MEEDVAKKDSNRERTADMLEEHNTSDNVIKRKFSNLSIKPYRDTEHVETNILANTDTESMDTTVLLKPAVLINYKRLYEECEGNLEEQRERYQKRVVILTNEHNEHMRECCKADYERASTEYNTLQGNFDKLEADNEENFNIMKTNLDTEIQDMDKIIVAQRPDIEAYEGKLSKFNSSENIIEHDKLIEDYEKAINYKDEEIAAQKETINRLRNNTCASNTGFNRRISEDDIFRMKPKERGSAKNLNENVSTCEYLGCESTNIDLSRCNICSKYVCKECNEVPVSKLKQVTNKCKTIYFICKACDDINYDSTNYEVQNAANKEEGVSSTREITNTIDSKLKQFSSDIPDKATKIDDEKLNMGNQLQTLTNIPEKVNENCKSFKDVLMANIPRSNATTNFKSKINESRNEQLVQERERKLPATNIIIHEVQEFLPENEDINDAEFINALFKTMGIDIRPDSITRLGKPDPNKSRPIKLKMKSESDKDSFMARLPNLKNAEDRFNKISVTEDYTAEERETIRKKVTEARNKSETEGEGKYVWKVRGSPKNGLRLIRFTKNQSEGQSQSLWV